MCAGYDSGILTVPSGRGFEARAAREGRIACLANGSVEARGESARCPCSAARVVNAGDAPSVLTSEFIFLCNSTRSARSRIESVMGEGDAPLKKLEADFVENTKRVAFDEHGRRRESVRVCPTEHRDRPIAETCWPGPGSTPAETVQSCRRC